MRQRHSKDPLRIRFEQFAAWQQERLRQASSATATAEPDPLGKLLTHPLIRNDAPWLRPVLVDPYFPSGMVAATIFSDVTGMRFFINKSRPELEPILARELIEWAAAFARIRRDIESLFDPAGITCIPLDGTRHPLPDGQWCNLCGICCRIGGVPPEPPAGIRLPDPWPALLAGERLGNQQVCPFLFQYFGESRYFCSIHQVKPMACRAFDAADCQRRLAEPELHRDPGENEGADLRVGPS